MSNFPENWTVEVEEFAAGLPCFVVPALALPPDDEHAVASPCNDGLIEDTANLFRAAPDLLRACEAMVKFYGYAEYGPVADARAAIRKATGEQP